MSKYDHIDFKPPESVAKAAERGLEYRRRAGGKGGLSTSQAKSEGIGSGVQRASDLKHRENLSPSTVKRMKAFFDRHQKNKSVEKGKHPWEDRGYVAHLLWGGDPGYAWAKKIVGQMEAADKKSMKKASMNVALSYLKSLTASDEVSIKKKIIERFQTNPPKTDKEFHQFAESIGIDEHKAEQHVYDMFASVIGGGLSDRYKGDYDKNQLEKGKKVEMEHLGKAGLPKEIAEILSEKIAKDHLAELSDYYDRLEKMESGAHKEALDFTSIEPLLKTDKPLDLRETLRAIRISMAAEQDAVHLYETIADSSTDPRVKKIMQHVADEEKVHVGEFQKLLTLIDPTEIRHLQEGAQEVEEEINE